MEEFELPATVLFREMRGRGYRGAITIHREYVRGVKDRKMARITERFETLPVVKRFEKFDFEAQPQVPRRTVEELTTLRFVQQGENVLLLGPCGGGKPIMPLDLRSKPWSRDIGYTF